MVKGVTKVHVDAVTGKIASLNTETPAQKAKETNAEAKESKIEASVKK